MKTEIKRVATLEHPEYDKIYMVIDEGEPMFSGGLVAKALQFADNRNAVLSLAKNIQKFKVLIEDKEMTISFISMTDVNTLAEHSDYEDVDDVRNWIESEYQNAKIQYIEQNVTSLVPVEYSGQRVLLTKQLAEAYGTTTTIISNNFNRNRNRYQETKHYFVLEGDEKLSFINHHQIDDGSKKATKLYFWTERGALLHAKSLNTDLAWEIYDKLVEFYFTVKESQNQMMVLPKDYSAALRALADEHDKCIALEAKVELDKPKVDYHDRVLDTENLYTTTVIAKEFGKTAAWMNDYLHDRGIQFKQSGKWILYQKYADKGYTGYATALYKDSGGTEHSQMYMKWTQAGRQFIHKLMDEDGYFPIKNLDKNYEDLY